MRLVGILGGMGPEATVLLMQKVIDRRAGGGDAGHVPLLVHQNPQVPSRIAALIDGTGESPAPVLADMARALARSVPNGFSSISLTLSSSMPASPSNRTIGPDAPGGTER